jgi:hypothetical protein
MKLRIRVVGDGSYYGTRVVNADTGEDIPCAGVTLTIGDDRLPRVSIQLIAADGHEFLIGPEHRIDPAKHAAESGT